MAQIAGNISITPAINLSVSYRSTGAKDELENPAPEAVIITDPHFIITGFNDIAADICGFNSITAHGQQLFSLIPFEMIGTRLSVAIKTLFNNGYWKGDILFNNGDKKLIFNTCCNAIKDHTGTITSIVITSYNIARRLKQEKDLVIAENKYQTLVEALSEGVLLINADGTIAAANKKAAEIFGVSEHEMKGKVLRSAEWKTVKEDGSEFPEAEYPAVIALQTGAESNNVVIGLEHINGRKIWLSVNCRAIFEEQLTIPVAAVLSIVEITAVKEINDRLSESESVFRSFMKDSPTLGWIYDEDGILLYGNPRFLDIIGLTTGTTGKNISAVKRSAEVLATIAKRNKEVLQNGKTIIVEEAVTGRDGTTRFYLSYWFLLPIKNKKKLIGGHAVEITDKKTAQRETGKMYERYQFATNASSDAIWDMDIATGFIYLSDTFSAFSGYKPTEIIPTPEWLFEKIHEDDKNRIRINIDHCLKNNIINWENEYRFRLADGSYRFLLDKAHAIYEEGKLTRVIGAMQDITGRKKLEAQLLHEQVQKQKMINQATINAQEKERNRICWELHDNVNQLLMSAKLHICVAKNKGGGPTELLEKANEYLLMAVEEIRRLSKTLTSTVITNAGLKKGLADIASTMLLLKNIKLIIHIKDVVVVKLSPDQQLMVYRIIQEQSNNILKYAETKEAVISLKEVNQNMELVISDKGKGFDKATQKTTGIGFINIFNRVDAYNGKVEIITAPGKGCTLVITFPIKAP